MNTVIRLALGAAAAVTAAACTDFGTPSAAATGSLAAFQSVPAGFSSTSSSFAAEGDLGDAFQVQVAPAAAAAIMAAMAGVLDAVMGSDF